MWGSLTGTLDGNRVVHEFGYVGLPDTYRIIIVAESGSVSASNVYTRTALDSSVKFDYATGEVIIPSVIISYLVQFAITFLLTILIEGIILLLFRIELKENWKVFLLVNFITQIVLTFTVGITLVKAGVISAYIIQIPMELIILVAETLVFRKYLVAVSNRRKVIYVIVANLVSWAFGAFFLNYMFLLLSRIS